MRIKRPRFDVVSGKPAAFLSAKYTCEVVALKHRFTPHRVFDSFTEKPVFFSFPTPPPMGFFTLLMRRPVKPFAFL